jgi:hypothetical protein
MPVLATIGTDALKAYDYAADYNRDQYFSSVGGLIVGEGANGNNNKTFLDSTGLNTVTNTGTFIQQGTYSPFTKYTYAPYNPLRRGGSALFTGTASNYLSVADSASLEVGNSNFCLEFFISPSSVAAGVSTLVAKRATAAGFGPFVIVRSTTSILVYMSSNGTSYDVANGVNIGTVAADTWYHIALYRVGTAIYGSVGGTVVTVNGSTSATLTNNTSAIYIGADSASQTYNGYMSSLRLVIGSSVYTSSNFTPPALPLTAITNTQLLINFTNSFVYDAAQNTDLVTIGTAGLSTSLTKWGGASISLPTGAGNYIQSVYAPNLAMGSGDFTIDFWVYQASSATSYVIEIYSNNSGRLTIRVNADRTIGVYTNNLNTVVTTTAAYKITYGVWSHIAVMRTISNTDIGVYIDGVRGNGATTNSTTFSSSGGLALGGLYTTAQTGGSGGINIEDLRLTPGVIRFTASTTLGAQAFIPPNGPAPLV